MFANIYDPAFRGHDVVRRLDVGDEVRSQEAVRVAGALQTAIFNSVNFSSIATDAKGVIQIFNVGAERMLGYTAAEVMNQITPADISDPQEVIARAKALSVELGTPIMPGFEALAFKASRGIEDIYELTYIRKDGSRFPAVVSVTALRDAQAAIIGYLLIGTDNTARKQAEEALLKAGALQSAIFNSANFSSIATDAKGVIQIFNVGAERMLGYTAAEVARRPSNGTSRGFRIHRGVRNANCSHDAVVTRANGSNGCPNALRRSRGRGGDPPCCGTARRCTKSRRLEGARAALHGRRRAVDLCGRVAPRTCRDRKGCCANDGWPLQGWDVCDQSRGSTDAGTDRRTC